MTTVKRQLTLMARRRLNRCPTTVSVAGTHYHTRQPRNLL